MRYHGISQWSSDDIGVATFENGVLADADGNVTLGVIRDSNQQVIVPSGTIATHDGVGLYSFTLLSSHTAFLDAYTATWDYVMNGDARTFETHFDVVTAQPYWDQLDETQRELVDNIYHTVSDGWDSTKGGPYIWEVPEQANFGFETIARLMCTGAITYINLYKPKAFIPPFQVGKDVANPFPTQWYGLLEKVTIWHLYRHLARSYLEQPEPIGVDVARLDRRQYYDKWSGEADREKEDADHMLAMLKRQYQYGLYSRSLLVSGGLFPISYFDPARPRWPYVAARF